MGKKNKKAGNNARKVKEQTKSEDVEVSFLGNEVQELMSRFRNRLHRNLTPTLLILP
jgi:hypothetical protein